MPIPDLKKGCSLCGMFSPGTCGDTCIVAGIYCGGTGYLCQFEPKPEDDDTEEEITPPEVEDTPTEQEEPAADEEAAAAAARVVGEDRNTNRAPPLRSLPKRHN